MAFGTQRGFLTGSQTSISTLLTIATGTPFAVSFGDLIYVVVAEQAGNTTTTVSDNLGNSYTQLNAGTVSSIGAHSWYSRVNRPGTVSSVFVVANGGTNNGCGIAVGVEGPFDTTILDKNPANITSDTTSNFTCPPTGTLTYANEVVVAWGAANYSTTWTAVSPNILVTNAVTATIAKCAIGIKTVTVTTTTSPEFQAAANPANCILGTSTFHRDVNPLVDGGPFWQQASPVPLRPRYPPTLGWTQSPEPPEPAPAVDYMRGSITFSTPRGPAYPTTLGWTQRSITSVAQAPFSQEDWPVPQRAALTPQGWINQAIRTVAAKPFAQYDWPVPQRSTRPPPGWIDFDRYLVEAATPFNQYDWPVPKRQLQVPQGWVQSPTPVAAPAVDYQRGAITFSAPRGPQYPTQLGWIQRAILTAPPVQKPFAQYDWPVPQQPPLLPPGWIDFDREVIIPFNQPDWPLPQTPRQSATLGWINPAIRVVVTAQLPFNQYNWPVPQRPSLLPSGWINPAIQAVVTVQLPFNQYDWPTPQSSRQPTVFGWINQAYKIEGPKPFAQYSWPLPQPPPLVPPFLPPNLAILFAPPPAPVTELHYRRFLVGMGLMGGFSDV